jgi:site-specific DNA-methyltransferase (adenine-specific)
MMKNRNLNHKDDWQTPPSYLEQLTKKYQFDFDPCPFKHNLDLWDGLKIDWGERNFINPPYSRHLKEAFVIKAVEQSLQGKLCVCLLPVSTSTNLFHRHILPYAAEIRFLKGRLKFIGVNANGEPVSNKTGQHDSMLVTFDWRNPAKFPQLIIT